MNTLNYFVHEKAICESQRIGENSRIWAFTHILPGAKIGENCNICDHVFIENDVAIGDNVTVKCGVQLWDGVILEDNVFIGPNVTFTNDRFPRSKVYPEKFLTTHIKRNASIGANATILPGIEIGEGAMVGAGAVVIQSIPENAIVVGNPARITGFVNQTTIASLTEPKTNKIISNKVSLYNMRMTQDARGHLTFCEFNQEIPFYPQRSFTLYGISKNSVRGNHAHKECHQFLVCVHGQVSVMTDDGESRQIFILNQPHVGLFVPAGTWNTLFEFSEHAVINVYASHHYDPKDYIHNYAEFKQIKENSTCTET